MLGRYFTLKNRIKSFIRVTYIRLRYPSIKVGSNLMIYGKLQLSVGKYAKVNIGEDIIFRSATKYNFVGINKPVSIAVANNAEFSIGNNSGFSGTSIFASKKIVIGKNCNFGGNTFIWDTDFHSLEYKARRINDYSKVKNASVYIGNDVFVGANSIILKGVTIGDRVIIGAGSVVCKDIPADEIWAGNPVRFIHNNTNI